MAPDSPHESILEFLNSAKRSRRAGDTQQAADTRCVCGSPMTRQKTTFFYDGRSWRVFFRVCLRCHPAKNVPTSDVPMTYDA
jgi:hypothetical protein